MLCPQKSDRGADEAPVPQTQLLSQQRRPRLWQGSSRSSHSISPSLVLWDGDPGPTPKLGHGLSLWHKIHSMELAAEARGATACSVGFPQDYTHLKVRAKLLQNPKQEPWQRGHQFLCRKHIQCFPANLPVHRLPLGAKVAAPHRWVQLSPCSLICSQMNKNEIKNSALPQ